MRRERLRSFLFNAKPEASMAMGHAVACGLALNELCQITFTPLLKSDSYYFAATYGTSNEAGVKVKYRIPDPAL